MSRVDDLQAAWASPTKASFEERYLFINAIPDLLAVVRAANEHWPRDPECDLCKALAAFEEGGR